MCVFFFLLFFLGGAGGEGDIKRKYIVCAVSRLFMLNKIPELRFIEIVRKIKS